MHKREEMLQSSSPREFKLHLRQPLTNLYARCRKSNTQRRCVHKHRESVVSLNYTSPPHEGVALPPSPVNYTHTVAFTRSRMASTAAAAAAALSSWHQPLLRSVPRRSVKMHGRTTPSFHLVAAAAAGGESQPFDAEKLVQSGAVVSAHGLKGEVRVMPFTDFLEERFFSPCTQYLEDKAQGRTKAGEYDMPPGSVSKIKVAGGREVTSKGRNECIVKFKGVNDRTAAEALVGRRMYVLGSERPQLREKQIGDGGDEFYAQELEGLQVLLQATGESVGVVVDVFRGAGTHDLLKVSVPPLPSEEVGEEEGEGVTSTPKKGPMGEHVFIPFVKDIVPVVDIEKGVLEITPPNGLLELRQKSKKPKRQRGARPPPPPKKKETAE